MPTYEYACAACGHEWEEMQRITAAPTEVCPKCVKSSAHRLISGGTNFILKGGGWYSDLYASPSAAGKKAEPNGATSSEGATKSEAKADTKSEAKPATTSAPTPPPASTT
jgi:putative FmdB family regulatory protein